MHGYRHMPRVWRIDIEGVSPTETMIGASPRGLDRLGILGGPEAGSLRSSMIDILLGQPRVHLHGSRIGGRLVQGIQELVRAPELQGRRWTEVPASRGHLYLGVLTVGDIIRESVAVLPVLVLLVAVKAML